MQRNGNAPNDLCVMATGGGAYKYYDRITQELGVEVMREDEMECLIIGMCFEAVLRGCWTNEQQVWTSSSQKYRERSSATAIRIPWPSSRHRHEHIRIC